MGTSLDEVSSRVQNPPQSKRDVVGALSLNEHVVKKGGKKALKKKKKSAAGRAGKGSSNRDGSASADAAKGNVLDREKVEKLVTKAKSHAQTVQAVKRAVYEIQLTLLDGVKNEAQLESSGALLTQSEYQDVVVERSIEIKCGYPLCDKPLLSDSQRKGRYRISVSEHKVYDAQETGLFCSQTCLVASKTFAKSLQVERDGLIQQEKLAAVIRSVRDSKASDSRKSELNHTDQRSDRAIDSLLSEVKERQDTEVASFEDAGPSDAIEGYTPVTSTRASRPRESNSTYSIIDDLSSFVESTHISERSSQKGKSALKPAAGEKAGLVQHVPAPKSILKKSRSESTALKRSVSWGDQKIKAVSSDARKPVTYAEAQPAERLASAQHVPAALIEAAEETAAGVFERSEADEVSTVNGSVSWGEQKIEEVNSDSRKSVTYAEAQLAERLASAQDVAAALIEAAEETAAGDFESSEAVARAGLSILSVKETSEISVSGDSPKEASAEEEQTTWVGQWPQVDPQEEADEEVWSSKAGWHDTAPKNFKLEISMFGAIWMALEEWISAATIAFIYGKEASNEEDFLCVNGREYRLQVICGDGVSAGISRAFSDSIARVLPDVVQALGLRVPLSTVEQALGRMVRTMSFVEPLPAFAVNHWRMLVMLFLEGLSVDQMGPIGVYLSKHSSLFHNLIIATGTTEAEYNTFRSLLLPSGVRQ